MILGLNGKANQEEKIEVGTFIKISHVAYEGCKFLKCLGAKTATLQVLIKKIFVHLYGRQTFCLADNLQ